MLAVAFTKCTSSTVLGKVVYSMSSTSNGNRSSDALDHKTSRGPAILSSIAKADGSAERSAAIQGHSYASITDELKTIVSAQNKILSCAELNEIIETLLLIAIENVAAERGLLFLARDTGVEFEAEAIRHADDTRVFFSAALPVAPKFSQSVLRHVVRFEEKVVLPELTEENLFSEDEYLRGGNVRSILCLPLFARRDLVGVLYLENKPAPEALESHRLVALEVLASSTAIALKTARMHTDLHAESTRREMAEDELERVRSTYGDLGTPSRMIGGLTAALAHEISQPMNAILLNAQSAQELLKTSSPDLEEVKAAIDDIVSDDERALHTVRSVRATFQREAIEMSAINLVELLHDVGHMLSSDAFYRGVSLRLTLPPTLPIVIGNKTQLVQVVINLIVNAFEAVAENDSEEREVEISASESDSGLVSVFVCDSGKGIDSEIMPRLFEAFFTTKPTGMGMGLAIASSIAMKHGGRLLARQNPIRGATMIFELPVLLHCTSG
jgi:signal transduction histidine kinase